MELYQNYRSKHGIKFENGMLEKFLLGFSVYSNTRKLMNTDIPKGADHLGCIDGIRFLSMSWVVLCHVWGEFGEMPLWDARYNVLEVSTLN